MEGLLYHCSNYRGTLSISGMTTGQVELLEDAHCRRYRRGSRIRHGGLVTTGQMEQQADNARVIPLQEDCTTTWPFWNGPTCQSDALDSEPTTCYCHRGTGLVIYCLMLSDSFQCDASVPRTFRAEHLKEQLLSLQPYFCISSYPLGQRGQAPSWRGLLPQ